MTKGVEIKDLIVATGNEAARDSIVVASVREFLRRGDEVSPSPLFGTKVVVDLGRRESIAGLRYGIPGMRVGGTREIVISPHLAYGNVGIPGRIPANALLRCEVELLEIREHSTLLPQDWLPGKILMLRRCQDANDQQPGWTFTLHESGNSWLSFLQRIRLSQYPIPLEREESVELIRHAMDLPKQMQDDCVGWNSGFIGMVIHVLESGKDVCLIGVHESPKFPAHESDGKSFS